MSGKSKVTDEVVKLDELNLTELMDKLDQIVIWFNQGDIDIDQATVKFDEGVKLAELIKQKLSETENKVNQIKLKLEVIE